MSDGEGTFVDDDIMEKGKTSETWRFSGREERRVSKEGDVYGNEISICQWNSNDNLSVVGVSQEDTFCEFHKKLILFRGEIICKTSTTKDTRRKKIKKLVREEER